MNRPNYDEIIINMRWSRRAFFQLARQDNLKMKIKRKLIQFNNYLNSYGLKFKNIEIIQRDDINDFNLKIEENLTQDEAVIFQRARDTALMSERSCIIFRTIKPVAHLISLAKCNHYKRRLNQY